MADMVYSNARGETVMNQQVFSALNHEKVFQSLAKLKDVKHMRRRDRRLRNGSLRVGS